MKDFISGKKIGYIEAVATDKEKRIHLVYTIYKHYVFYERLLSGEYGAFPVLKGGEKRKIKFAVVTEQKLAMANAEQDIYHAKL